MFNVTLFLIYEKETLVCIWSDFTLNKLNELNKNKNVLICEDGCVIKKLYEGEKPFLNWSH